MGTSSFYHYDELGSTSALTDENETVTDTYSTDAWGNELVQTGSTKNPFRWNGMRGYYHDADTGTFQVRQRSYRPTIGVWLSMDSIWPAGGQNAFSYVGNKPLSGVDPTGEVGVFFDGFERTKGEDTLMKSLFDKYNGAAALYNILSSRQEGGDNTNTQLDDAYEYVCGKVCEQYSKTRGKGKQESVDLFGWSRGGAMAITLAKWLNDKGCKCKYYQPHTEWTDLTFTEWLLDLPETPTLVFEERCRTIRPVNVRFLGVVDPVRVGAFWNIRRLDTRTVESNVKTYWAGYAAKRTRTGAFVFVADYPEIKDRNTKTYEESYIEIHERIGWRIWAEKAKPVIPRHAWYPDLKPSRTLATSIYEVAKKSNVPLK